MSGILQPFFTHHARNFREGRIAVLSRSYRQPVTMFVEGDYYLLRRRADLRAALSNHYDALPEERRGALAIGITEERFQRPHHGDALVTWHGAVEHGRRWTSLVVRYYLTRHNGEICVEMIEFVDWIDAAVPRAYLDAATPIFAPPIIPPHIH